MTEKLTPLELKIHEAAADAGQVLNDDTVTAIIEALHSPSPRSLSLRGLVSEWRRHAEADRSGIAENDGQREKDLLAQSADTWALCADALEERLDAPMCECGHVYTDHDDGGRCAWVADGDCECEHFTTQLLTESERSPEPTPRIEPELPSDAARGYLCVGEDAKACAEWITMLRRNSSAYWTDEKIATTLFAHRHNMMRAVEAALQPEWEEARRRIHETGNSGWTHVVSEAIDMLREGSPTPATPCTCGSPNCPSRHGITLHPVATPATPADPPTTEPAR